jgi:GNAT superfamily N-acetyltransferase
VFARVNPLSPDALSSIHPQAGRSIFWELAPDAAAVVQASGDPGFEKEAWLTTTLLEYGTCGFSLERSTRERAVATILFCARENAPGAEQLPTSPVSDDAEVLTSLFIDPGFAGIGLESVLLDAAIMFLVEREARAVEAFGWRTDFFARADVDELLEGPVGNILRSASEIGLMSVPILESAGFKVIAEHPVLPRLRLELPPQQSLLSVAGLELLCGHMAVT